MKPFWKKCIAFIQEGFFLQNAWFAIKATAFFAPNTEISPLLIFCPDTDRRFASIVVATDYYDPVVRQMIDCFKFKGGDFLGEYLAQRLWETDPKFFENAIYIPIPLHPIRRMMRGFNQSRSIAQALCLHANSAHMMDIFKKTRWNRKQSKLSRSERILNTRGVFGLKNNVDIAALKQSKIIIIDDVIATGSTLNAAAQVLIDAGVSRSNIHAAVIAGGAQPKPTRTLRKV